MNPFRTIPRRLYIIATSILAVLLAAFAALTYTPLSSCERLPAGQRSQCLQDRITRSASHDIADSFELLAKAYALDKDFANNCHGSTHEIGKIAYEQFARGKTIPVSSYVSYCGYGFYHGFIEELLIKGGKLAEAQQFCLSLKGESVTQTSALVGACYHGIGHGVTDGTDPRLWGNARAMLTDGLALCAKVGDSFEHRKRCASGAFNSIAIMYFDPKYGIAIDNEHPYTFCEGFSSYERHACVQELNTVVLRNAEFDFPRAVVALSDIVDIEAKTLAAESLAGYAAIRRPGRADEAEAACRMLPSVSALECLKGFAAGLIEGGSPGEEHVVSLAFCQRSTFSEPERTACTERVLWYLAAVMPKKEFKDICLRYDGAACHVAL